MKAMHSRFTGRVPAIAFRGLSVVCIMVLLALSVPEIGMASRAAGNTATDKAVAYGKQGSYAAYSAEYASLPRPDTAIELKGTDGVAGDNAQTEIKTLENKQALVWSNADGWVTWEFTVEQAGRYQLDAYYYPLEGTGSELEFELMLDGAYPFEEAQKISLTRLYRDTYATPQRDNKGNDIRSTQQEISGWKQQTIADSEGFINGPYLFALTAGKHTLRLKAVKEPSAIAGFRFYNEAEPDSYEAYLKRQPKASYQGDCQVYEAEQTASKTSSMLYPLSDRSDSMTSPSDPVKKRLNTIGGANWKTPNQQINWEISVPADGYYKVSFRFTQNFLRGFFVSRRIEIDGSVPFKELEAVRFPYGISWQEKVLGNDEPYHIYLTKGKHTLTITPVIGDLESLISDVNYAVYELNEVYRKIVMVTSTNPDLFRDYFLQESVPGMTQSFQDCAALLRRVEQKAVELTGHSGSEAATLARMAEQLESFLKEPNTIPSRLEAFRTNISSLASWVLLVRDQSLTLDKFAVCPVDTELPRYRSTAWERIAYQTKAFFGSFFEDYATIGSAYESGRTVTVWVSSARDQAEVLKNLIDSRFSPSSKIGVNLSLVQGGLLQATMAGKAPDVTLMVGRGDPLNYALRGAVYPLDGFDGFDKLITSYMPTAMDPYYFDRHCYGLPETQNFHMMFYRTDIFQELGLQPPDTWDDLLKVSETLQRNNMNIGLPYVSLDAYSVVSQGLGGQTIFPTLLLQNGNGLYNTQRTATALDTTLGLEAFKTWTGFYTQYGFPVYKDDYNRFRTGEMPLVISYYTFYNMLSTAAPEIRNMWAMIPVPGTRKENGSVDRSAAASGTACIMLSTAKDKEASWEFIRWWCGGDTQAQYGVEIENVLGSAGRYNPANVQSMERLAWSGDELEQIMNQWQNIRELPEIPGGYYTARNIDNAFKAVIYDNENPREALNYWNRQTNNEILRKRREFGLEKD